ncbi:MAG: class GN sortase [Pseudomonadota bacterium]
MSGVRCDRILAPTTWVALLLLLGGATLGLKAAVIPAKAMLAQRLLSSAWRRAQAGELAPRPWSWADAWPVARLQLPDAAHVVLAGTEGSALAFAPAWVPASAAPGSVGTTVIAAHRDTHFRGLERLAVGDSVHVQTAEGTTVTYRVSATEVHNLRRAPLLTLREDGQQHLALITCYPFDTLRADPTQRYVVWARAQPDPPG